MAGTTEEGLDKASNQEIKSTKYMNKGGDLDVRLEDINMKTETKRIKAKKEVESKSWGEFTKNTTFHGVKYIFEKSPHRFRRILWVAMVLAAMTSFVIQVSLRVVVYLEYNTSVDVQVIFTDQIQFPAVTICNQNSYRLTKTDEFGLYPFINYIYGSNTSMEDVDLSTVDSVNSLDFVMNTAHQQIDLIDSCTWRKQPCDLSVDFVRTMTDMGVCYTFNSGRRGSPLNVTDSGSGNALSLVLNVEQYEYMKGPQSAAGVKVLLHDTSEFPMVKDLGFAVAIGTHTLVDVKRKEVISSEPPWGSCNGTQTTSRSTCLWECRIQAVMDRCGCRDATMDRVHTDNVAFCNITRTFGCVRGKLDTFQQGECTCGLPCRRLVYEPSLSNAQLSKFNVESVALRNITRRQAVQEQFHKAIELFHHVDYDTVLKDQAEMQAIRGSVEVLQLQLVSAGRQFEESGSLMNHLNSLEQIVDTDSSLLESYSMQVVFAFYDIQGLGIRDFVDSVGGLYNNLEGQHIPPAPPPLVSVLEACRFRLTYPHNMTMYTIVDEVRTHTFTGCDKDLLDAFQNVYQLRSRLMQFETSVDELTETYQSSIDKFFTNNTKALDEFQEHPQCLTNIDNFVNLAALKSFFTTFLGNEFNPESMTFDVNTTFVKYNTIADFIIASDWNEVTQQGNEMITSCTWHTKYTGGVISEMDTYLAAAKRTLSTTRDRLTFLHDDLSSEAMAVSDELQPTLTMMTDYLSHSVTRAALGNHFTSYSTRKAVDNRIQFKINLKTTERDISQVFSQFTSQVLDGLLVVFNCSFPLMNEEKTRELSFVKYAADLSIPVEPLLSQMSDHEKRWVALEEVWEGLADTITNPITEELQDLIHITKAFEDSLEVYTEDLSYYVATSKIKDTFYLENFIRLDIYYSDLYYERVTQHPSFELLSLLGEIGGFLGLLLGASILTVCELLDHLTLAVMVKFQAGRKQN